MAGRDSGCHGEERSSAYLDQEHHPVLHYCEAAGLFDSNESFCPVATTPRQYDSDYARAIYARRRLKEWIGGRSRVVILRTLVEPNETVGPTVM